MKQLWAWACAWTIVAHVAPWHQDENKTALLVLVAHSGNSIYRNFEETAVIYQNDSLVNVVINYIHWLHWTQLMQYKMRWYFRSQNIKLSLKSAIIYGCPYIWISSSIKYMVLKVEFYAFVIGDYDWICNYSYTWTILKIGKQRIHVVTLPLTCCMIP